MSSKDTEEVRQESHLICSLVAQISKGLFFFNGIKHLTWLDLL